jgi:hypothetical protein
VSLPIRAAVEERDLVALRDSLAPDVELRSPISSRIRFQGRDQVAGLLGNVLEVLDGLHYTAQIGAGSEWTLVFRARVRGQELEGADVIRLDSDGLVREIVVFIRPLHGIAALSAELGPRLVRPGGRARAALVSLFARPLAAVTRWAEPMGARLVKGATP